MRTHTKQKGKKKAIALFLLFMISTIREKKYPLQTQKHKAFATPVLDELKGLRRGWHLISEV